jgi:3-hydroxymyristoyl/3-hydroxydecanoyl-(acyl carrier protein) dehydratase
VTGVKDPVRRRPTDILRGLVPWLPIPATTPPGPPIVLEGEAITSILPYDRPDEFLRAVRLFPDGKTAEGFHIVDPARCQGHRFGTPLLPGSVLGDLLYLTFGVLLRHSPLLADDHFAGRIGVRARDEDFRYRRRVAPGTEVTVGVELLGRRGELLAAHGWATAEGETVFEARRCWVGLIPPDGGVARLVPSDGGQPVERGVRSEK